MTIVTDETRTGLLQELQTYLDEKLAAKITASEISFGDLTLHAHRESIADVMLFLRDNSKCQFISFIDVCGADYPERALRFDVVYHLLSPKKNLRIRVKTQTNDVLPVQTIVPIFPGALWFEREAYDMYGIIFDGHPDLRRLLTDYGFEGHPLRKDFPLTGYVEVRYDDEQKRVVYEPVKLNQEFRQFDFLSPWDGYAPLPGDEKANVDKAGNAQ